MHAVSFDRTTIIVGYVIVFAIVANVIEMRWNPRPPLERYLKDPDDFPLIAFWNMFSTTKWTDEGITFHRRRMLFVVIAAPTFLAGWALLAWVL